MNDMNDQYRCPKHNTEIIIVVQLDITRGIFGLSGTWVLCLAGITLYAAPGSERGGVENQ